MNKYLYLIKKLKIKPWIKYWLVNYKNASYILSEILTGTEFFLQDSAPKKFKIFDIIGRTTQESTKGDNLISSENINTTVAGVTYASQLDGTILANGTKNGGSYVNLTNNVVTLESGNYPSAMFLLEGTIQRNGVGTSPSVYLVSQDDSSKSYNIGEIGQQGKTQTIDSGTYYLRIAIWLDNTVFSNAKIGLMLVKGSTIPTEFEKFTNGPSPNPNYPQEIHSTGDSGSVNEKVSNSDGTQEQDISFPLAQGQKLMEGDYLADDGVHHKMKQTTVSGTEATLNDAKNNGAYYCNQKPSGNLNGQTITFDTSVTNAIVQYELASEAIDPYTEEQQTAWEQIKNLKTYKPVTHISSEDETPAELKIQYYKEG